MSETNELVAVGKKRKAWIAMGVIVVLFAAAVLVLHKFAATYFPPVLQDHGDFGFLPAIIAILAFPITLITRSDEKVAARRLIRWSLTTLALLIAYATTFNFVTVRRDGNTYQIGFSTAEWSLRDVASEHMQENPQYATPGDLMVEAAAFYPGGPSLIWKPWTIWTAGLLLGFLYGSVYLCLSVSVALLFHHPQFKPTWMHLVKLGGASV